MGTPEIKKISAQMKSSCCLFFVRPILVAVDNEGEAEGQPADQRGSLTAPSIHNITGNSRKIEASATLRAYAANPLRRCPVSDPSPIRELFAARAFCGLFVEFNDVVVGCTKVVVPEYQIDDEIWRDRALSWTKDEGILNVSFDLIADHQRKTSSCSL